MTLQFALNRLFVVTANLGSVFEKVSNSFNFGRCGVREWSVNLNSLPCTHKCWAETLTCKLNYKSTIKGYKTCEMSPAPPSPPSLVTLWGVWHPLMAVCTGWVLSFCFAMLWGLVFSSALLFDRILTVCLLLKSTLLNGYGCATECTGPYKYTRVQ